MKKLDIYIIKKFLGTFFFSIILIISIAVVFDLAEKIDDFIEHNAQWKDIFFTYYANFIPYFAILFSNLFTFIAVIFFTSKLAYNTEIIAILSSGVSFKRFLFPYFISAFIIASLNWYATNYLVPGANEERFIFEEMYYHDRPVAYEKENVHKQIEPGLYMYMERFITLNDVGRRFSLERFEDGKTGV